VAPRVDLGKISNQGAMVDDQRRGRVLWFRDNLMELATHSIYSVRERWLRILKEKAGGRREGVSHRRGLSWLSPWQSLRRWMDLLTRFTMTC
jgi:hypothetical protein